MPWLGAPSSIFKVSNIVSSDLSLSQTSVASLSLTFLPFYCQEPYNYVGLNENHPGKARHLKILDLTTSAKSLYHVQ